MNNPKLIPAPFAINGQKNSIPDRFSSEMPSNTATWDQGFPPITTLPATAGGQPPIGQDFNGIFNQVSENIVFLAEGGRYKFSEDHAASIGGYKQGAILQSDDNLSEYQSLINGNLINFNTATEIEVSAAWKKVLPISLSSKIDSTSETTAATSLAVKKTYDLAASKLSSVPNASLTQQGITQLSNALNSNSETTAATSKAVRDALSSLGTVATRDVGTGSNQIPDMSSFSGGWSGGAGWRKGPDGVIEQWGMFGLPMNATGVDVVFPVPFPSRVESISLTQADIQESQLSPTTMPAIGVNSVGTLRTGFTARMSGGGGFNLYYIAIGR